MDESPLAVEEIELVVEGGPSTSDGGGVGEHAETARDLGEVASRDVRGGLAADTELEAGRAPVDKLDRALGLDGRDGRVDVLGDDVSAVEERAGHVLARAGVALDHLVVGLEAREGKLGDAVRLVTGLGARDDRGVCREREVDPREAGEFRLMRQYWEAILFEEEGARDEVSLELVQVDVEGSIEAKGRGDARDDLG